MDSSTHFIELIKKISYDTIQEQGYVKKFDGIVVSVNEDNTSAEVRIMGYDATLVFPNKSNSLLVENDSVKIESPSENFTDAFISEKFGTTTNLAESEIKEMIVEFNVNDSPVVAPPQDDPDWSAISIDRPLNRYIWQRTRIVYADKETFSTPVNITGANGSTPPLCNIYGENIFKYDFNGELISGDTITLTADVIGTTVSKWQYKNDANTWIDYPSGEVSDISLIVSAMDNVFFNDVATIRCTTQVASAQDIVSITKIRDGSGVGIDKIVSYYLATSQSSGVTTETVGWTTEIQTVTKDKKYLWTYEKIEYSNETSSNSLPIIIGTFSADGVSIENVIEYYKADENGINPPTTGWTTDVQTMTPTKKYLWNYEEIIFNDTSTHITDKRIIGVYGESAYTVLLSNENVTFAGTTVADPSSAISLVQAFLGITTMPTLVGEIQNLPNGMSYTIQNNNTTSTQITISVDETFESKNGELQIPITVSEELFTKTFSYSLVLNGEQGVGVATIINEFYLSTSKTELVGGEWSLTSPAWEKGLYVWVRQKIVYTDETIEYTEPLVDSSWEAVNDLEQQIDNQIALIEQQQEDLKEQVDGQVSSWFYPYNPTLENIPASDWTTDELKTAHIGDTFTNIESLDTEVKDTLVQFDNGITGTNATVEVVANENIVLATNENKIVVGSGNGNKANIIYQLQTTTLIGKTLTTSLSYKVISETTPSGIFRVQLSNSPYSRFIDDIEITATGTYKIKMTTSHVDNASSTSINFLLINVPIDCSIEISDFKIEIGDTATPWIPNPADGVDMPEYELTRCGKNLLRLHTESSVYKDDGFEWTITPGTGALSGARIYPLNDNLSIIGGRQYVLSSDRIIEGEATGTSIGTARIAWRQPNGTITYMDTANSQISRFLEAGGSFPYSPTVYGRTGTSTTTFFVRAYNLQLELGSVKTDYEPYHSETFTIKPNTPLKLLIKEGVNTFYTSEGVDLTISYQNSDSGKSYKFTKTDGVYSWKYITDNNIQQALKQSADADGKSTHFIIQPTRYQKGDLWTLAEDFNEYRQGDILTATQDSDIFVATHWIKSNSYLDQVGADDHFLPLIENNSSLIEQKANEIILMVEQTYSTEEDLVVLRQTLIELTAEQIEFVRTTLGGDIDNVDGKVDGNQALLEEYIRFIGAMIELGRSDSPYKVQLNNERLSFLQDGQEVAYLSNKKLHITEAQIEISLGIGNFSWQPRANGNLSLVYIGGV